MRSIKDLFKAAGGTAVLAAKFGLHQHTVDRWEKNGIPIYYWDVLSKRCGFTIEELFRMNLRIINKKKD